MLHLLQKRDRASENKPVKAQVRVGSKYGEVRRVKQKLLVLYARNCKRQDGYRKLNRCSYQVTESIWGQKFLRGWF